MPLERSNHFDVGKMLHELPELIGFRRAECMLKESIPTLFPRILAH